MIVTFKKKEVHNRAYRFLEFALANYEMGQAQDFIRDLCEAFGCSHKGLVSLEHRFKKVGGNYGRIDGFCPGRLLIEMKSPGEDLDAAYIQAKGYLHGLKHEALPEYIAGQRFRAPAPLQARRQA